MSSEALSWALEQPLGGAKKIVLLGIANHADRDGRNAWPSVDTLAMYAHVEPRSVTRAIAELENDGYVEREIGQGGTRAMKDHFRPNLYHLRMAPRARLGGDAQVTPRGDASVRGGGDASVTRGVTPRSPPGGDASVTQTTNEPPLGIPPLPPEGGAPGFEKIAGEYPRPDDRARARTEWDTLQPDAPTQQHMLHAIAVQRTSAEWQREQGRFVPKLWKWLRNRRWLDVPPAPPRRAHAQMHVIAPAVPMPAEVRARLAALTGRVARTAISTEVA